MGIWEKAIQKMGIVCKGPEAEEKPMCSRRSNKDRVATERELRAGSPCRAQILAGQSEFHQKTPLRFCSGHVAGTGRL